MAKKSKIFDKKKRIKKPSFLVAVSLDRESAMLWKRIPSGERSQLVQLAIKSHFNKVGTVEEAEERLREQIRLLAAERQKEVDKVESYYNSLITQRVAVLEEVSQRNAKIKINDMGEPDIQD